MSSIPGISHRQKEKPCSTKLAYVGAGTAQWVLMPLTLEVEP